MRIVKNKVARLGSKFDIMYGEGISPGSNILDVAADLICHQSGSGILPIAFGQGRRMQSILEGESRSGQGFGLRPGRPLPS